jgi:hypothetical protein
VYDRRKFGMNDIAHTGALDFADVPELPLPLMQILKSRGFERSPTLRKLLVYFVSFALLT